MKGGLVLSCAGSASSGRPAQLAGDGHEQSVGARAGGEMSDRFELCFC